MSKPLWRWATWLLWLTPFALIGLTMLGGPLNRSMTPIYHAAAANWWALQPIYAGSAGFNYLPIFVPFFGLFSALPLVVGELLWRALAIAGLYLGLSRWTGRMASGDLGRAFFFTTLFSLPLCLSAFRNGQSSAQLAACLVFAACCLHAGRLGWAALWLSLALVCKPLAIAAIGLAVMAYPRLWWRAGIGVLGVLLCPYFLAPAAYVNELYVAFGINIADCFNPAGRTFADINGVLMAVGLRLEGMPSLLVRVGAGLALAVICGRLKRAPEDPRSALVWLALTGCYIMLFTPMNEANSYVMLAPSFGLWALWFREHDEARAARMVAVMSVAMLFAPDLVGIVTYKQAGNEFAKFLYPLMTIVFLWLVVRQVTFAPSPRVDGRASGLPAAGRPGGAP